MTEKEGSSYNEGEQYKSVVFNRALPSLYQNKSVVFNRALPSLYQKLDEQES